MIDNHQMPTGTAARTLVSQRVPRVVLADDDELLREGLASLLDRLGFDVVGQAGDGTGLLFWSDRLSRRSRLSTSGCHQRMPPRAFRRRR
jgi:hypothetical protein